MNQFTYPQVHVFKKSAVHSLFPIRATCAAILAGLSALGAGTADAVHVSPDGVGSVLIYPYYSVRNPKANAADRFDTYVSVVNKTNHAKAIKVRFLEGRRGAEVSTFNLFLSPHDTWTGAAVRTVNGAVLISNDQSCVVPINFFELKDPTAPLIHKQDHAPNIFKNYRYEGLPFEGGIFDLDRTREGYIVMTEMGVITEPAQVAALTHNASGVPENCALIQSLISTIGGTLTAPSGGLFGRASLVSATTGTHFAYDATALTQWSDVVKYSSPGANTQTLVDASPAISRVLTDQGVVQASWANPRDAVSAVLMHNELMNEYVLDSNTLSGTDWIVTFPTKYAYVATGNGTAQAPFQNNYNNGSCEQFVFNIYDREGVTPPPSVLNTAAPPPPTLCWATNVLSFDDGRRLGIAGAVGAAFDSNLLGSDLKAPFLSLPIITAETIQNGWAAINFSQISGYLLNPRSISPLEAKIQKFDGTVTKIKGTHYGLPAVGFMVHDYVNQGVISTYGGLLNHKTSREIDLTTAP